MKNPGLRRGWRVGSPRRVVFHQAGRLSLGVLVWLCGRTVTAGDVELIEMFDMRPPVTQSGVCFYNGLMYAVGKGNVLAKYDPETGEQLEIVDPMIPGLTGWHIHGITVGSGGTFWVGETHSGRLYQLRFSDYSVIRFIGAPPGGPTFGLASHAAALWVGHHSAGPTTPVHYVDPLTEWISKVLEFGAVDVHGLAWAGGYLWALDNSIGVVYQVDCTGDIREVFTLPPGPRGSLAYDGTHFWTSSGGVLFQFDLPVPAVLGDFDADGHVDQEDFPMFEQCFAGWTSPQCALADFDEDCDVDCLDWSQFTLAWDGEGSIPNLQPCGGPVPAVFEWGIIIMALLLTTGATIVLRTSPT